ncbi:unnamed protein product, partial [Hapterophycus canaliculatus]
VSAPQELPEALRRPTGSVSLGGVKVVLLDIEGTTTPITFVKNTLFPYAGCAKVVRFL